MRVLWQGFVKICRSCCSITQLAERDPKYIQYYTVSTSLDLAQRDLKRTSLENFLGQCGMPLVLWKPWESTIQDNRTLSLKFCPNALHITRSLAPQASQTDLTTPRPNLTTLGPAHNHLQNHCLGSTSKSPMHGQTSPKPMLSCL